MRSLLLLLFCLAAYHAPPLELTVSNLDSVEATSPTHAQLQPRVTVRLTTPSAPVVRHHSHHLLATPAQTISAQALELRFNEVRFALQCAKLNWHLNYTSTIPPPLA
jgi:hypothetical protein